MVAIATARRLAEVRIHPNAGASPKAEHAVAVERPDR
jgi:hypothetical protein